MQTRIKSVIGICPRCSSAKTLRVDPQRNLLKCEECDLWFEM